MRLNALKRYSSTNRELVSFAVLVSHLVEAPLLLVSSTPSFVSIELQGHMTDGVLDAGLCYASAMNEPKLFDPYVNFPLQQSMSKFYFATVHLTSTVSFFSLQLRITDCRSCVWVVDEEKFTRHLSANSLWVNNS